jgi:hypothetical protein
MPSSETFGIDINISTAKIFNFIDAEHVNQLLILIFLVFVKLALRQHCEATFSPNYYSKICASEEL